MKKLNSISATIIISGLMLQVSTVYAAVDSKIKLFTSDSTIAVSRHLSDSNSVRLLYCIGENVNGINQIEWSAVTSSNKDCFIVEKSLNAVRFQELAIVKGIDNSSGILMYGFTDLYTSPGVNYYRLRYNDDKGNVVYSPVLTINPETNNEGELDLSFDATNHTYSVFYEANKSDIMELQIISENGTVLYKKQVISAEGENYFDIDSFEDLAKGEYTISLKAADNKLSRKITKK